MRGEELADVDIRLTSKTLAGAARTVTTPDPAKGPAPKEQS
jgi:hypothetical protein